MAAVGFDVESVAQRSEDQRFRDAQETLDDSSHRRAAHEGRDATDHAVRGQDVHKDPLDIDQHHQDLEQHGLLAVVVVHEQLVALGYVHEEEQSPDPDKEAGQEHGDEVEVGTRGTHVAWLQVVGNLQHRHDEEHSALDIRHLEDRRLHEADPALGQGRSRGTDETAATWAHPVDHVPALDLLQHGSFTAVPGHGQLYKVAHCHAQVDAIEQPDKAAGFGQDNAEHGEEGHHEVYGVYPEGGHHPFAGHVS